ncbi:MAG: hypothetical protein QOE90_1352 [Thermoplasmata archaeon]|jgi:hypothetical protein|nr:hypothetical protein [Thermoplasmata archaeon]
MDFAAAWASAQPWIARLAIWRGYESDLETLLIYAVGIALYTALVFAFYQNISRVEAFVADARPRWVRAFETALLFPLMSMLYFGVLAASLFLLAKSQSTYQILELSMAVVLSVRVTAFLSEEMSADLAKLLPLGLLGVLLVDPGALTLGAAWLRMKEATVLVPALARFFVLFIVAEALMRGARWAYLHGRDALHARATRRVPVAEPVSAKGEVVFETEGVSLK